MTSRMACFQSLRARLPRIPVGNREDSPFAGTGMKGVKVKLIRVSIVLKDSITLAFGLGPVELTCFQSIGTRLPRAVRHSRTPLFQEMTFGREYVVICDRLMVRSGLPVGK